MAISITTLNNESAVAKTFVEVGKDLQQSQWINTTEGSASFSEQLTIKQSIIGKRKGTNIPIRRTLVQIKSSAIDSGTSSGEMSPDEATINVTITAPSLLTALTDTMIEDALAKMRNFLTATNLAHLRRGEV